MSTDETKIENEKNKKNINIFRKHSHNQYTITNTIDNILK